MKPGKRLEGFVATLEKVLVGNKDTRVESPYRVPDRTTGTLREHDVAVIITRGHHELVTAIECRDRSRPVGVPQVEAFHQKCADTGVNRGVIVSSRGFCRTARKKAAHLGIDCLHVDTVDSFDWLAASEMQFRETKIEHARCTAISDVELSTKPNKFIVRSPTGTELTNEILLQNVKKAVDKITEGRLLPEGTHTAQFSLQAPGCTIEDLDTGDVYPMKHFNVTASLVVTCTELPFTKIVYRQDQCMDAVGRIAVTQIDCASFSGDLVLSRNEDALISVVWLPKPRKPSRLGRGD